MFGGRRLREQKEYYERLIAEIKEGNSTRESYLRAQIQNLEKMVFAPTSATIITDVAREADAIITVSEKPIIPPEEGDEDVVREFDTIISGDYE